MVAPVAVFGAVCRDVLLLMGNNSEVSFIINSFSGLLRVIFQTFDRATVGGFSCSLCAYLGAVSRLGRVFGLSVHVLPPCVALCGSFGGLLCSRSALPALVCYGRKMAIKKACTVGKPCGVGWYYLKYLFIALINSAKSATTMQRTMRAPLNDRPHRLRDYSKAAIRTTSRRRADL